jgi:CheY-like chemotaxis protein/two-component sensor histidine kinase
MLDRQVGQLVRIVDDLLDTTRLAKGKIVLRREILDWSELVRDSVEDARSSARDKGVDLTVSLNGPVWVSGDPVRLNQVAANLLGNAIKYTGAGGHVRVQVRGEGGDGLFTVTDDGVGMSDRTLSRLFEPFVRGDEDRDNRQGGLGMGLALAKSLVDLHGGAITGASAGPGQGATFTVCLPLAAAPSVAPAAPQEQIDVAQAKPRVLIVEDNVDAAESLRDLLELMGYTVALAPDGAAGLRQLEATHPAAVLCDIGLPGGMDGYDVARAVRANHQFDGVYLVAVSGYGLSEDKRRAREAGFNLHMTKPVDPAALNRTLARIGT